MFNLGLKPMQMEYSEAMAKVNSGLFQDLNDIVAYYRANGYTLTIVKTEKDAEKRKAEQKNKTPYRYASATPNAVTAYSIIYDNKEQNTKPTPIEFFEFIENVPKPLVFNGTAHLKARTIQPDGSDCWSANPVRTKITNAAGYFGERFKFYDGSTYYISANTFFRKYVSGNTKGDVLSCLNNIVIDVDCHKGNYTEEEIHSIMQDYLADVDAFFKERKLCSFNIAHFTPRGIQFWFHLVQDSIRMKPVYLETLTNLANAFEVVRVRGGTKYKDLDVDITASKRLDGWFRAFGSGKEIIIYHNQSLQLKMLCANFVEFSVEKSANAIRFGKNRPTNCVPQNVVEKTRKTSKPKTDKRVFDENGNETDASKKRRFECYTHRSLNGLRQRLNLIEWGIEHGKAVKGYRDKYLFHAYNAAIQVFDKWSDAKSYVRELNKSFESPLSDTHLRTCIFKLFERRLSDYQNGVSTEPPAYRYKNADILEQLNICTGEYQDFQAEKTQAGIRKQKQSAKAERDERIIQMKLSGKTIAEIVAAVGVSESTVHRVIAKYKSELEQRVDELNTQITDMQYTEENGVRQLKLQYNNIERNTIGRLTEQMLSTKTVLKSLGNTG